jgi:hypothetical protein
MTASSAWACTNFIRIDNVAPATLQPSTSASVRGVDAVAGSRVELRWNRVTGPVLAESVADANGTFVAQVQVPNVTPGLYVLTATSDGHVARSAIQVGVAVAGGQTSVAPSGATTPAGGTHTGLGLLAAGLLLMASAAVVLSARRPARVPARRNTALDAGSLGADGLGAGSPGAGSLVASSIAGRPEVGVAGPSSSAGDRRDDLVEVGR